MTYLHRNPAATYWRFYQHIGKLSVYPVRTLAHIVTLYGPGSAPTQLELRKRALAELTLRGGKGNEEAGGALRDYMGIRRRPSWEEQAGTDPNTGFPL